MDLEIAQVSERSRGRAGWPRAAAGFVAWSAIFAVVYAQSPLFASNQHQYYLHGLARAGVGFLSNDWLAGTVDPLPAFSELIYLTQTAFGSPTPTYFYYALLMGVYLFSIWGIADRLYDLSRWKGRTLVFVTLFLLLHSAAMHFLLSRVLGTESPFLLEGGVANQRLLGQVFQPSVFGVFLLLSVTLFLRGRRFWALVPIAVAAYFNSIYLLSAALLTVAFMIALYRETRDIRQAVGLGVAALALVAPALIYTVYVFRPTSLQTAREANDVLAQFRNPYHAAPAEWFDWTSIVQILLVLAALWVARRTKLFVILLTLTTGILLLTAAQLITGSSALALIYPWRPSVVLVPLSAGVLLGAAVTWLGGRLGLDQPPLAKWVGPSCAIIVGALFILGAARFGIERARMAADPARPLMDYVAAHKAPTDLYLVPAKMESFRLATGAPVYVDFKSTPYRDTDVLEWDRRIRKINTFYQSAEPACEQLERFALKQGVTHVVLPAGSPSQGCPLLTSVYADASFGLFALEGGR